ncbi:MAG: RNA methyltransferase [Pseudomonadota bacterium]
MQPAIILVRPQLGENIGKAARAMLNFSLTDLRLVAPRDGWPNPDAGPSASGADGVLDEAQVFETVDAALADCNQVFATTVRPRDMIKDVFTPKDAIQKTHSLASAGGKTAFLFGPERSGLENEDVARADAIVTAPVNPDFGSLNLAQAVVLVAYEHFQQSSNLVLSGAPVHLPATKEELSGLYGQLEEALSARDYFHPENRAELMRRTLRNILERAGFSAQEVQTLRGMVKSLLRPPS